MLHRRTHYGLCVSMAWTSSCMASLKESARKIALEWEWIVKLAYFAVAYTYFDSAISSLSAVVRDIDSRDWQVCSKCSRVYCIIKLDSAASSISVPVRCKFSAGFSHPETRICCVCNLRYSFTRHRSSLQISKCLSHRETRICGVRDLQYKFPHHVACSRCQGIYH